jgi:hypothetical protein
VEDPEDNSVEDPENDPVEDPGIDVSVPEGGYVVGPEVVEIGAVPPGTGEAVAIVTVGLVIVVAGDPISCVV